MKRLVTALLVMVLVLGLSSCGGSNETEEAPDSSGNTSATTDIENGDTPKEETNVAMVEYSLNDLSFSLPEGFVLDEENSSDDLGFQDYKSYYGEDRENVTCHAVFNDTYDSTIEEPIEVQKKYSLENDGLDLVSEEKITINGLDAILLKMNYKELYANYYISLEKNGVIYFIHFNYGMDEYQDYDEVTMQIIDTIK